MSYCNLVTSNVSRFCMVIGVASYGALRARAPFRLPTVNFSAHFGVEQSLTNSVWSLFSVSLKACKIDNEMRSLMPSSHRRHGQDKTVSYVRVGGVN